MEKKKCKVEVFSRVTGFYRPVQSWNPGKQSEQSERKHYDIDQNFNQHQTKEK